MCVNDDSTMNSLGDTCSNSRYDEFPEKCGDFDTAPFTASVQCCSCGGGWLDFLNDFIVDSYRK